MMMRLVTESGQRTAFMKWMRTLSVKHVVMTVFSLLLAFSCLRSSDAGELTGTLRDLDVTVLSNDERQEASGMISRDIERRRLLAIQRENMAWPKVKSRDDWERFRDQRLTALRESLGQFPPLPKDLNIETTGRIEGDGYRIENIVFESHPGLWVTANLYMPTKPKESMPAVLFSHSHHNPKTQGELQDMGMTWARQGWLVLVMDLLGHGERRQHPFVSSDQYPKSFRVGRQDYYFRYNVGLQLQLVGESLMGWMVWDLMRGVDLLCSREGVDKDGIVLIGSVAGGGDPAAVTAALDPRIDAVAPFNFGGPQPDYPIPEAAEKAFYYFGVAYWETTRCLRLGGRDGFAHWVIAASAAPRSLIYSHEFAWDRTHDPVWPRLEKVFSFYGARDRLAVATGRGHLKGRPPESTHCNNVGIVHRRQLYPHLARWFDMQPPADEFQDRHDVDELLCLTPEVVKRLDPQPVYKLAGQLADERIAVARKKIASVDFASRRTILRKGWSRLLGNITPSRNPIVKKVEREETNGVTVERIVLEVEPGIVVPLVMMWARDKRSDPLPVVIALADSGTQKFLAARPDTVSTWLEAGCAVCLVDVRGFGETGVGGSHGPRSIGTTLSCRDQVLGQTLLGSRVRDLRSVVQFLRERRDLDEKISLWGDSLAAPNPPERSEVVPHGIDNPNVKAEPSSGLLVLLTALFEDTVNTVYARGTFASFRSLLDSQFLYVPHDSVVPGALTVSDVADIAAALVPRPLRVECPVDGLNREIPFDAVAEAFAPTSQAYRLANASEQFSLNVTGQDDSAVWLLDQIKRRFQK
jgi:cephalosporin-C deacetylase-like acetyl esterase